jgi:hypothetical protein
MTEIVLTKLYEIQDINIEHVLPTYNGSIPYFVEAAGDIYRELCHDPVDFGGYIAEKRRRLRTFYEMNDADIKEIRDVPLEHSDWYILLADYMIEVDALFFETEKFDFSVYRMAKIHGTENSLDRKELMLAVLEDILAICLYAKDDLTKERVDKIIKDTDEMFDKK